MHCKLANVEENDGLENNEEKENGYSFCGAMATISVQRSQKWWDHAVNDLSKTDFIQNLRMEDSF